MVDSAGDFVVWSSLGPSGAGGDPLSIQAQRLESNGLTVGGEFRVNTYTTHQQHEISVAIQPGGDFLVVWGSRGSFGTDTDVSSIQGRLYVSPIFADGFESGDTSAWTLATP